jgi:hypothetical protein
MKEIFDYPMFEILSDSIYTAPKESRNWDFFEYDEEIYLCMKSELSYHCEFWQHWRIDKLELNQNLKNWRAIVWALTNSVDTPLLPLNFLVYSQKLNRFMPEIFRDYAIPILQWFDVKKYRIAYDLSQDEYDEICEDLKQVLPMLENYPKEKFVPKSVLEKPLLD